MDYLKLYGQFEAILTHCYWAKYKKKGLLPGYTLNQGLKKLVGKEGRQLEGLGNWFLKEGKVFGWKET